MLQKIDKEEFDKVYMIMEEAFPDNERRSYEGEKSLLSLANYDIYVMKNLSDIKAFVAIWDLEDYIFIEHFAVNKKYRNQGLGSKIINKVLEEFDKTTFLEVEPIQCNISEKRVKFYERNGFYFNDFPYKQPALEADKEPIPLKLMTSRKSNKEELMEIKELLYEEVYVM